MMTNHTPAVTHQRRGFTLFEVTISLIIVAVGVLSVMMLMPYGIKGQQLARFQILASAKAIEIMSVNANQWKKWDQQRMEGQTLGLCSINQVAMSSLVEQKACNWRHGSLPVPLDIARRLSGIKPKWNRRK
jgi:prepilin-type N-terminal cleavage/methylation domain-containing protein